MASGSPSNQTTHRSPVPTPASPIEDKDTEVEKSRKKEIIDLLHEYNDIKDATQILLSAIADIEGITSKDVHLKYNLPLDS